MGILDIFKRSEEIDEKEIYWGTKPKVKTNSEQKDAKKAPSPINSEVCVVKENTSKVQCGGAKTVSVIENKNVEDNKGVLLTHEEEYELYRERYVPKKKKNIIILAVENSDKVKEYSDSVMRIVSKIIEDNKNSLFSIFRMGDFPKYFGLLSQENVNEKKVKEQLLIDAHESDKKGYIYDVLRYVKHLINTHKISHYEIEMNKIEYEITGYNIVFIGNAVFESDTYELSSEILKELKSNRLINSIKYFCIDDKSTINAATIGFPIIGHIETNFYK